jgi:pimeloyl-ACP methyl ester carboxylesterase
MNKLINRYSAISGLSAILLILTFYSCTPKRTQEPEQPYPYNVREVSFMSADGKTKLSGTVTAPKSGPARGAIVLLSGSGPDDRDYTNQFGHRPFLVLADYLTRNGITVLRYDERGVGKSSGDFKNASYEDLALDAVGAVKSLQGPPYFYNIGIIGHSEGGGMAALVAQKVKTEFLVLMAPDNSTARESLLHQTDARLQNMEVDEETRQEILAGIDSLLSIVKTAASPTIAKTKMLELVEDRQTNGSDRYKEVSTRLGDPERFIEGCLDPKFIYRLQHDPKELLSKVDVPVLLMFGDDDHALDVKTNLPLMKKALEYTWHDVKIFPGVGHLFMNSKGVAMNDLDDVEETIAPEVLKTIDTWIKADSVRRRLYWIPFRWEERKQNELYFCESKNDWNKTPLAVMEKDGRLKISPYWYKRIYLEPVHVSRVAEGNWSGTFRNDSLEVTISGKLEKGVPYLSLAGFGTLVLKSPTHTTRDTVYITKEEQR